MSVTGLCQICETAEAEYACDLCGAAVCADHYEAAAGACVDCARTATGGGPDGPSA